MSEFRISDSLHTQEVERVKERNLSRDRLFVLLLGPSATGKSTIISEMNDQSRDCEFEYVKPIMTRPNRPGETDKIHVSDQEFDLLDRAGEFVVVNGLYGVRYGTPLQGILEPLQRRNVPILDYPLETVRALQRPEFDTLNFYIYPSSIEEWQGRVESSGRNTAGRLESGIRELGSLATSGLLHPDIDISIVNADGQAGRAAAEILDVINLATR
jgi:guanylate kinase